MEEGRRRRGSGRDRISGLPDELLHEILRHLRSSPAAAPTSALSRRWRRVWAGVPDLVLGRDLPIRHGASFLDAVDAALESYDSAADPAAHLHGLEISARPGRDATFHPLPSDELELPPCERATSIRLLLSEPFLLRPPPIGTGTFAALAELEIVRVAMDARELEVLVSSPCPRLQKLILFITLVDASDLSLRSATLRHLKFHVSETRRLDVAAPALQVLHVSFVQDGGHIAAPDLAEVSLDGPDAGCHLQRLDIKHRSSAKAPLMQRFDTVNELRIPSQLVLETKGFIPNCKTLGVSFSRNSHACVPCMMRLIRRSNGIRKLVISAPVSTRLYCSSSYSCRSPQSAMADIILDSLEEIDLHLLGRGSAQEVDFLEPLLSMCNAAKLKGVEISIPYQDGNPSLSDSACRKILEMSRRTNVNIRLVCVD
ncbi:FBD-associated F-box protein At2g26860 [Brachypodium distachyon]|uniref:FBD-associated F-box protein At2g26860 n=1 Tax=Brachypodium distachyon TaxID=15368 RepID=UPI000D0D1749|nr:FBD-associated F-box protein At2g26860 [Brachypodium distachyon]|eukprot:XP_024314593.1 FBD-associated F-box protein At2g26860 [Brachypodium distachyon]